MPVFSVQWVGRYSDIRDHAFEQSELPPRGPAAWEGPEGWYIWQDTTILEGPEETEEDARAVMKDLYGAGPYRFHEETPYDLLCFALVSYGVVLQTPSALPVWFNGQRWSGRIDWGTRTGDDAVLEDHGGWLYTRPGSQGTMPREWFAEIAKTLLPIAQRVWDAHRDLAAQKRRDEWAEELVWERKRLTEAAARQAHAAREIANLERLLGGA